MKRFPARFLSLVIGLCALCQSGFAGLDLTAGTMFERRDGDALEFLTFSSNEGKIRYAQPHPTRMSGGGNRLEFVYTDKATATTTLIVERRPTTVDEDLPPKPTELQALTWAKRFLGARAKDAEFVEHVNGAFPLGNRRGREIAILFSQDGIRFGISIGFIDFDESERLFIVSIAQEKDFESVRETGLGSMYSWTPLKAEPTQKN
jgi:hypothetical protein